MLERLRDRRAGWSGDRRWARGKYNAQVGRRDPPILPEEAEAREPKSLTVESQAQQQRV
jgi:hypothetical protein